jgi:hypothetical protein
MCSDDRRDVIRVSPMAVSRRDREYLQRLGAYKEGSHAEAAERHRALPVKERLERSWQLFLAGRGSVTDDRRDDNPDHFYDLARRRGLYRA